MDRDEVARELYRLDPGEFVAARTSRVKQARAAGDRELATEIGALRRPTVAAWGVNLLADGAPEQLAELLDVGVALAEAQRRPAADRLRELAGRRRTVVAALARRAAALAADRGRTLSDAALREISETLQAALADSEVAEAVRTGTVATASSYSGFGPVGPVLTAVPEPATEPTVETVAAQPVRGTELDSAASALATARTAAAEARAAVDTLRAEASRNAAEHAELEAQITALRAELSTAQDRRRFLAAAEAATRKSLQQAEAELHKAELHLARSEQQSGTGGSPRADS
ncbi:hypothetical protein [Nocardia stercoris]|uniref:Uncharacterized protein n=1 Tax=Nocardia stercoris TaxID=2483361 RepID=A0A3M2KZG1_9NOCA|nr:hypothetical protein [Nocardia stercoris]RMI29653.1 hypothetical protein EBN03_24920 [Nocardia stercoris]